MAKPGPKTWILRCKIHRTTVLLYAEPTTTMIFLKSELHKALSEANPTGSIETQYGTLPIPQSIDDIILGRLIDPKDLRGGWELIEGEDDGEDFGDSKKGKGKAVAGTGRLQNGASKVTAQSAGLRDGALVAVKFKDYDGHSKTPMGVDVNDAVVWDVVLSRSAADEFAADEEDDHDSGIDDSELPEPAGGTFDGIVDT